MSWLVPALPSIPGWSRSAPAPKDGPVHEEEDDDLDAPPMFPLPDSHQRSKAPASATQAPPSFALAPPSPPRETDEPASELNIAILPDATPLGNMAPPPSTTSKPNFGLQAGGADGAQTKKKGRGKVALGQGYSALDWARLTQSGADLKGTGSMGFMRVTMEELAKHKTKNDAWSAFNGKVYNITPYLPFHPGGEEELMRVAGRDGTKLFMLTHSWVNMEYMMQDCMVGVLVRG